MENWIWVVLTAILFLGGLILAVTFWNTFVLVKVFRNLFCKENPKMENRDFWRFVIVIFLCFAPLIAALLAQAFRYGL